MSNGSFGRRNGIYANMKMLELALIHIIQGCMFVCVSLACQCTLFDDRMRQFQIDFGEIIVNIFYGSLVEIDNDSCTLCAIHVCFFFLSKYQTFEERRDYYFGHYFIQVNGVFAAIACVHMFMFMSSIFLVWMLL